jgi:hypothetical protein
MWRSGRGRDFWNSPVEVGRSVISRRVGCVEYVAALSSCFRGEGGKKDDCTSVRFLHDLARGRRGECNGVHIGLRLVAFWGGFSP